MATFYPFLHLPSEIRIRIWELTAEPRIVEVRYQKEERRPWGLDYVSSSTPVPAVLQACHESRNLDSLYQRSFAFGKRPRYAWVNFEIDIISLGRVHLGDIPEGQPLIRQLMFEATNDESFFHFQSQLLTNFCNVKEIRVICVDGLLEWRQAWKYVYWPCGRDSVTFIDKDSGEEADGRKLNKILIESGWPESSDFEFVEGEEDADDSE